MMNWQLRNPNAMCIELIEEPRDEEEFDKILADVMFQFAIRGQQPCRRPHSRCYVENKMKCNLGLGRWVAQHQLRDDLLAW